MHQHLRQEALPHIPRASLSLHSVYDLIRRKKHELSKRLLTSDNQPINLPKLHLNNQRQTAAQEASNRETCFQQEQPQERAKLQKSTPAKKYRTILDLGLLTEEKQAGHREISQLELYSKQKQQEIINQKHKDTYCQSKRIKTQVQNISRKVTNTTQIESHRFRENSQAEFSRIEEAKQRFLDAVTAIPKSMKMRNESNLLAAVQSLEVFNPFANRNHRIVNICLLKMGKTVILNSSILYKIGEEMDCFYLILYGKVKLVNGPLRKICYTGETLLEEVIFTDRQQKIALEKAKAVGKTVLLQISTDAHRKLKEELIKFGYKLGFQEMESIIKRNYIVKNWLRNKIRQEINNS